MTWIILQDRLSGRLTLKCSRSFVGQQNASAASADNRNAVCVCHGQHRRMVCASEPPAKAGFSALKA